MSSINGDKARFHRKRKSRLALRERSQEMRKKLAVPTEPRGAAGSPPVAVPTGADL